MEPRPLWTDTCGLINPGRRSRPHKIDDPAIAFRALCSDHLGEECLRVTNGLYSRVVFVAQRYCRLSIYGFTAGPAGPFAFSTASRFASIREWEPAGSSVTRTLPARILCVPKTSK